VADVRLARHRTEHVFRILKLGLLRTLPQRGKAATGAEPFTRRLTV
jgi:hypothetical protein